MGLHQKKYNAMAVENEIDEVNVPRFALLTTIAHYPCRYR